MLMRSPENLSLLKGNYGAIKHKMDTDYTNNLSLWSIYWTQGNIAVRAESGDESLMAQLGVNQADNGRGNYFFMRIRPVLNMISGYQRRNRKSTVVVPLENGDNVTADQWTKILLNIYKREHIYETISEAFHGGALLTGMNMLHVYLDFRNDPVNGDIKVDNLAYNEYMIDPYFRNPDLSDASFIWRRSYLTHAAAALMVPEEDRERVMRLQGNPTGMARDGRFQYMPEAFGYTQSNRVAYDEYYYRDYREATMLIDTQTGDVFDISYEDKDNLDNFLRDNPTVIVEKKQVPTIRLAIQIQDEIFYDGQNPLLIDEFPFIGVIGFYNKSLPYLYSRIQGVTKSLIDPQILFNRRLILSMDYAESTINTGWMFKEGSLVDPAHLFQTGQGRILPLKADAQMTDVQAIPGPNVPPSFFQLQESLDNEIYNCAGLSQENLGKIVNDDASGYLSALRQGAGLTAQQPIFDRLDLAQNMLGNRMMEIIQRNYTPAKIRRMLEGEEPAAQFYNKAFGKYHAQVQLGFNTESQQQMEFAQILELKKVGVNIPDKWLIEKATLQGKQEIIDDIHQQNQQQMEMQQQQMQAQMQQQQAQSQLFQARAAADMGLYSERTSRVEENRAMAIKQLHESNKEDALATLDMIKAMKELQEIDLGQIEKLLSMIQSLKAGTAETAETTRPTSATSAKNQGSLNAR